MMAVTPDGGSLTSYGSFNFLVLSLSKGLSKTFFRVFPSYFRPFRTVAQFDPPFPFQFFLRHPFPTKGPCQELCVPSATNDLPHKIREDEVCSIGCEILVSCFIVVQYHVGGVFGLRGYGCRSWVSTIGGCGRDSGPHLWHSVSMLLNPKRFVLFESLTYAVISCSKFT